MKKKLIAVTTVAALGIIGFWCFGLNRMMVAAAASLIVAGVFALVADVLFVCDYIREHKYY